MVPYSPIKSLEFSFLPIRGWAAIQNVVVALKERLKKPGVLAASLGLFCFYRGRLLSER